MKQILFSSRLAIAKEVDKYIQENKMAVCTFNVVTALVALGYLKLGSPSPSAN